MVIAMSEYKDKNIMTFPVFCLLLYFTAEYARIPLLGPLKLALAGQVLLLGCLLNSVRRIKGLFHESYFRYYIYMLVIMALHVFLARNNYWAFLQLRLMLSYFIIALSCYVYLDTEKKLLFIISFILSIHFFAAVNDIAGAHIVGNSGPLGDENDFALAMNVATPLAFFIGYGLHGIRRYIFWACAVFLVIGNVIAGSRGGFVGFACVVLCCIPFFKSRVKAVSAIFLLSLALWLFIPQSYRDDIISIKDEGTVETGTTGYGRMQVWELAWVIFKHHPVLGVGQGNVNRYLTDYTDESSAQDYWSSRPSQWGRATHSVYFTVIPELGIVGFFLFFLMVKRCFRGVGEVIRSRGLDCGIAQWIYIGLLVGLVGYLTTGIFISAFYYPQFWNFAPLILVASGFYQNNKNHIIGASVT